MKKIVKLLKAILEELSYIRECRVIELRKNGIVPPGTPPDKDDPEN